MKNFTLLFECSNQHKANMSIRATDATDAESAYSQGQIEPFKCIRCDNVMTVVRALLTTDAGELIKGEYKTY